MTDEELCDVVALGVRGTQIYMIVCAELNYRNRVMIKRRAHRRKFYRFGH